MKGGFIHLGVTNEVSCLAHPVSVDYNRVNCIHAAHQLLSINSRFYVPLKSLFSSSLHLHLYGIPSLSSLPSLLPLFSFDILCFFFAFGVGMRVVMCRVSADLPALMTMCLFDWKAVRSRYATRATTEDDQSAARGADKVCVRVCV